MLRPEAPLTSVWLAMCRCGEHCSHPQQHKIRKRAGIISNPTPNFPCVLMSLCAASPFKMVNMKGTHDIRFQIPNGTYYPLKEIVTSLTLIFPIVVPASLVAVISAILAVFSPEKVSAPQGEKNKVETLETYSSVVSGISSSNI